MAPKRTLPSTSQLSAFQTLSGNLSLTLTVAPSLADEPSMPAGALNLQTPSSPPASFTN